MGEIRGRLHPGIDREIAGKRIGEQGREVFGFGHPQREILDQLVQLRVVASDAIAGLGRMAHDHHRAASALELDRLLERGPPNRAHRGQDERAVAFAADPQFLFGHGGPRQGFKVDEINVDAALIKLFGGSEGGLDGRVALQAGFHRRDRIDDGDIATVDALAQHIGQALHAVEELADMRPVGHAEVVARWRPFPPTAVGRVVKAVERQQGVPMGEIAPGGIRQLRAGGAPTAAIVAFEPDPGAVIEMHNRTIDLGLDQIRGQPGLVIAGAVHPALRAEVVPELDHVAPATAVVATVDHPAALVPIKVRLEEPLLRQGHHDIAIIQAYFGGARSAVDEQSRQLRHEVVAFAPLELLGQTGGPEVATHPKIQLVGEEEVQPFTGFARVMFLPAAEKLLGILRPGDRVHGVKGRDHPLRIDGDHAPAAGGRLPGQFVRAQVCAQIHRRARRQVVGCRHERGLREFEMELARAGFPGFVPEHTPGGLGMLLEDLVHAPALPRAQGVVAQAHRHAALLGFLHEPGGKFPPRRRKQGRVARIGQAVGAPAGIAVRVINLQAHDPLARELVHLPGEPLLGQRVAQPPKEAHVPIAGRRPLKTG